MLNVSVLQAHATKRHVHMAFGCSQANKIDSDTFVRAKFLAYIHLATDIHICEYMSIDDKNTCIESGYTLYVCYIRLLYIYSHIKRNLFCTHSCARTHVHRYTIHVHCFYTTTNKLLCSSYSTIRALHCLSMYISVLCLCTYCVRKHIGRTNTSIATLSAYSFIPMQQHRQRPYAYIDQKNCVYTIHRFNITGYYSKRFVRPYAHVELKNSFGFSRVAAAPQLHILFAIAQRIEVGNKYSTTASTTITATNKKAVELKSTKKRIVE